MAKPFAFFSFCKVNRLGEGSSVYMLFLFDFDSLWILFAKLNKAKCNKSRAPCLQQQTNGQTNHPTDRQSGLYSRVQATKKKCSTDRRMDEQMDKERDRQT